MVSNDPQVQPANPSVVPSARAWHLPAAVVVFAIIIAAVLAPGLPVVRDIPHHDSGCFLYVGQQILDGRVLYRDVALDKGPSVFFINALGLLLGRGSMWGVWFLELGMLTLAAAVGFVMLRRTFGTAAGFFGSVGWLLILVRGIGKDGGNFTEEYAILFQFLALWIFIAGESKGYSFLRCWTFGLMSMVVFFLKPTLIGVFLAIGLYILITRLAKRDWRGLISIVGWMASGAATVAAVVVVYLAANGALAQFWDGVFYYTRFYVGHGTHNIDTPFRGFAQLSPLSPLLLVGWGAAAFWLFRGTAGSPPIRQLLAVAVIGLPIEIAFASASGRSYYHYYMSWMTATAILVAFFAYVLMRGLGMGPDAPSKTPRRDALWKWLLLGAALVPVALPLGTNLREIVFSRKYQEAYRNDVRHRVADYVRRNTGPNDAVVVWGSGMEINFVTHRSARVRFDSQFMLYTRGYATPALIDEYLDRLRSARPALIVDPTEKRVFAPIDDEARKVTVYDHPTFAPPLPEMDMVFAWIHENYKPVATFDDWVVYRRNDLATP